MLMRALTILGALGICTVAQAGAPTTLQAQTAAAGGPVSIAFEIGDRSRERALRWANTAPVIECLPAPLTELPGGAAQFSRPRIAPLEEAFLDASLAKRQRGK